MEAEYKKEEQRKNDPFIEYLFGLSQEKDRGVLADLRKGFSKATAIRAWPHIGRYCHLNNDQNRIVYQTIAAGYATHPVNDPTEYANFGSVMRALVGNDDSKRQTFDTQFRRILSSESSEEVCQRIRGSILAAKSKNVSIPWNQLFWDLKKWENDEDKVKVNWAAKYWGVPKESADFSEEDSETENDSNEALEDDQ